MKRAGAPEANYESLRAKIMELLPEFFEARRKDM
jgi:hypothetical protein